MKNNTPLDTQERQKIFVQRLHSEKISEFFERYVW